jgi:hypothetical protein
MTRFTYAVLLAFTGCFFGSSADDPPDTMCTAMGCEDGFTIQFSARQPGAYTFDIVADGTVISCTAELPLLPCGTPASQCSDARVFIGESGCALSDADHSLENLTFSGVHPDTVTVTAHRDGAEIASQTFTPTYQRLAPNGEECGPICHNASATLTLSDAP